MANYKWAFNAQSIIRLADGAFIPLDAANTDYQAFLTSGETPEAADPVPTPPRQWTPYEFYSRFSSDERKALKASTDANVQEFITDMGLYQVVYPDSDDCKQAMAYLVSVGILTQDRMTAILS